MHERPTRSPSMPVATLLVFALSVGALACDHGLRSGAPSFERADSAGIELVLTHRPEWSAGDAWTVDSKPRMSIGEVDGEAPYLFADVRGAVRLDDGSIVIADGQSREVRFFDRAGTFTRAVGGPGGGPREFPRRLSSLARCGPNRIYARDRYAYRVLEWDTRGEFVRSFQLVEPSHEPARGPYEAACTDRGGFVASGWGDPMRDMPKLPAGGGAEMYTQMAPVWLLDSLGALKAELGSFLSSERIAVRTASGGGGSGPHPFGRATTFAAAGGRIFVGSGEGIAVSVYDTAGHRIRIQRALTEDISIDQALLDAYRKADLSEREAADREWLEQAGVPMPPELPGYTAMHATPDGHLWVKRFALPGVTSSSRWGVFSPDGVFMGNVELPAGLEVVEIGDDYVLGVTADSLGVQRVELHPIRRGRAD